MVQRPAPLQQGDFSYQRDNTWPRNDRSFLDIPDSRFVSAATTPTSVHPRPQTIDTALKECAGINVKQWAVIARLENGEDTVWSSQSLVKYREKIFNSDVREVFRRSVKRATATENSFQNPAFNQEGMYSEFNVEDSSGYDRKHSSSGGSSSEYGRRFQRKFEDSDDDELSSAKKRRFASYRNRQNSNDDTPVPVPVKKTQQLMIGDAVEVEKFYQTRFKDMQQSSCKVMGKAFVKLVEPKKQTHHPYTKGDDKAPPWWPNTTGDNHVRHKEPDHLLKPERIRLLIHILRMVVKPAHQQHPTVQKLGLNVRKLEEVTMEAMSNWFSDKEHPENALKKPFLKEIFRIARAEERYLNGEIDGTTTLSVMYGERAGTEESDGEDLIKLDEDEEAPNSAISVSMPSPDSIVSPATGHNPHLLDNDMRMRSSLPMRQSAHPPMEEQPQYNDSSAYYHPRGMGFHPQSPNLQDRRPSFVSPPAYPSPQQQMYGAWPAGMVSNSPGQSFYTTSPQQNAPYLPPPSSQQPMLPLPQVHNFDGLPQGRYDTGPALGNSLRTGSMSHPHQHMPGFDNFLPDNGSFQQHANDLKEEQQQHLHHSQQQ
ncbi:hypothetical protein BDZ45DRAFT_429856 [Acephala macrosclerotiorum]|nr:hypothetical protein BDZ45DRAFT_429856 [Acephala macrosclerotiorum]